MSINRGDDVVIYTGCYVYDVLVSVAIESLQLDIVKQLIEAGCDVNSVESDHHSTALYRVVRYCQ